MSAIVSPYERALPQEFVRARTRTRETNVKAGFDMVMGPSYIPLGYHITCVPDALYGWPLWQVRQIRKQFDPGFVPIFRRMAYRTPAGAVLEFIHHGIARYDPLSPSDRLVEAAPLPFGWKFERPNVIERWFEPRDRVPGSIRAKNNLPRAFVPWTEWVARFVEETYWEASNSDKLAYIAEHGEETQRRKVREAQEAETAYRAKTDLPYQRRVFESFGADDIREVIERTKNPMAGYEPKPFVQIPGEKA
jgi:hypothetical protein